MSSARLTWPLAWLERDLDRPDAAHPPDGPHAAAEGVAERARLGDPRLDLGGLDARRERRHDDALAARRSGSRSPRRCRAAERVPARPAAAAARPAPASASPRSAGTSRPRGCCRTPSRRAEDRELARRRIALVVEVDQPGLRLLEVDRPGARSLELRPGRPRSTAAGTRCRCGACTGSARSAASAVGAVGPRVRPLGAVRAGQPLVGDVVEPGGGRRRRDRAAASRPATARRTRERGIATR